MRQRIRIYWRKGMTDLDKIAKKIGYGGTQLCDGMFLVRKILQEEKLRD